jgi:hypothetical protein
MTRDFVSVEYIFRQMMNLTVRGIFVLAAIMEVPGDTIIHKGLLGRSAPLIAIGCNYSRLLRHRREHRAHRHASGHKNGGGGGS